MTSGAAFFDLDRTLLRGASGPVFTAALRNAGVLHDRVIPGESLVYGVFNLIGETLPTMLLTRELARFSAGWEQAKVKVAGAAAAEVLTSLIQPYALAEIERHRSAGRKLVMATTTPQDIVEPLAETLGFDAVVATRYEVDDEGTYTGGIDGEFVWSRGKLRAVQEWAVAESVELSDSWAYSDSWYDQHLLAAVGGPVAVNPDARMRMLAILRRWPIRHLDAPEGVPRIAGIEPQQVLMPFLRSELLPYARFEVSGAEKIPELGGAIIVANHRSYFDLMALGVALARAGRTVRFAGRGEVFDAPIVGHAVRAMGGLRLTDDDGSGDDHLRLAAEALDAGELVALLPEGELPGATLLEPSPPRVDAAKLAALTGVPVLPVGLSGTDEVWPATSMLPDVLNVLNPPTIQVTFGPQVALGRVDEVADTATIMAAIGGLLPPELAP